MTNDNTNMGTGSQSSKVGGKRKRKSKSHYKGNKKPFNPINSGTQETDDPFTPASAPAYAASYIQTNAGTALVPSFERTKDSSFGHAAASDDEDDESEVEITLVPKKVIIDMTKGKSCLEMEGLAPVGVYGFVFHALLHERQTCDTEPSYKVIVLKNLIALFQALLLFEDCLAARPYGGHWNLQVLKIASSTLQGALGYEVRTNEDNETLYITTCKYKAARTKFILSQLRDGNEPEDPKGPGEALLIQLIDRKIVYDYTKSPLISKLKKPAGMARVALRAQTVKDTLADAAARNSLYTDFGAMVPLNIRGDALKRPWHFNKWVVQQGEREATEEVAEVEESALQSEPVASLNWYDEANLADTVAQSDPVVGANTKEAELKKQDNTSKGKYPQGYVFGSEENFFKYGFSGKRLPADELKRWEQSQDEEKTMAGNEKFKEE